MDEERYVATYEQSQIVGYDQSQMFRKVKILTGEETVSQLFRWAVGATNIAIIKESPPL